MRGLLAVAASVAVLLLRFPALTGAGGELIVLSRDGQAVFAVVVLCIALWVTEVLPFAATALLGFALLGLTGAYPGSLAQRVSRLLAEGMGSPVVIFLLGVMLLGAAIGHSGLAIRLAAGILRLARGQPRRVLLGFLGLSALLGMWLSPVAAASVMVPVAVTVLNRQGCAPGKSRFGQALMLAVVWGCLSGGIATPAGTTANPIVMDVLRSLAGIEVGFLDWMRIGVPAMLLLLPFAWVLLILLFRPEIAHCQLETAIVEMDELPHATHANRVRALALGGVAVAVWIAAPAGWMVWSTLLVSVLLFVPGIGFLHWRDAERAVPWGALLVVAAGVAMGMAAYHSGLARYLAYALFARMLTALPSFWRSAALSWATALLHAVLSSNTVTGSIIAPLLIPLAQDLGLDVWRTLAPCGYSVSLAFLLVSETPTALIAYGTGYLHMRDFARAGVLLTLVAGLVVAGVLHVV